MRRHLPIKGRIGWLLLLFLPLVALAHDEPVGMSGYSVRRFTDENGLPQNSIKAIAPDAYGFLWLATEGGVVRFDGKTFRTYGKGELGLESARMLGFFSGKRDGELFAVTDRYEVVSIYQGTVRQTSDLSKTYYDMYARYVHMPGNDMKFGHPMFHWHPYDRFFKIHVADSRSYYACSADRIRYYRGLWQVFDYPYRQGFRSSFFLVGGHLYHYAPGNRFFTPVSKGLHSFTLDLPGIPADTPGDTNPTHLLWNAVTGKAYLHRAGSLFELSRKGNGELRAELLLSDFSFERHNIHSIYRDPATGTLFLGSSTEGLYVFQKHSFSTIKTGLGGDYEVFYAHAYYGNNTVLTTQGFLLGPQTEPVNVKISSNELGGWRYAMLVTRRHPRGIWIADHNWVTEFDEHFSRRRRFNVGPTEEVHVVYEGLDGTVWLGLNKGLFRMDPTEPQARFRRVAPIQAASFLCQPDDKYMWMGLHDGLCRLSLADSQWVRIPEFEGMNVRSLHATNASEMWVTTYGDGFFLIKDGRVVRFPLDRNAYLAFSHCILEDRNGFFWISTNKGFFQVAKNDLLAYAEGQTSDVYYFYYGKESGFSTNEFNGGCQPCGVVWGNGAFSFPSLDGLVYFNPYTVRPELPDKDIFFDHIEMNGKLLQTADTLTLPTDFSRITFYVTTPYHGNLNNLYLEASLQKGYGENLWTSLEGNNSISFTTLPPGTYRLVIRKPKGFGVGNYSYRVVVLVVPPAFWQTGWFMALAALLLVLGVYGIIRSRIRYVQHRNQELERLIAERTQDLRETIKALRLSKNTLARQSQLQQKMILAFSHDLKSPLMYLMITGQKLYENLRATPGKLLDSIQIMYHSAFNMYHFTDNFLDYAKVYFLNERPGSERFSLRELAQEKIEIFRYIAEAKNIELGNRIPQDTPLHMNRMLLSIIIHNLLDNAIKYTDEGYIDFSVQTTDAGIDISITDTGMGMHEDVKKQYADVFGISLEEEYINEGAGKGLGLQIVLELMHILGGQLHIHSEPEQGTVITLHFKAEVLE